MSFFIIAQAPKTVKIYANRQTLGFDDADSIKETQTLELEPKDFEDDAVVNLRFVKFQNITSLVVCIGRGSSCYGSETHLCLQSIVVCRRQSRRRGNYSSSAAHLYWVRDCWMKAKSEPCCLFFLS